MSYEMATSDFYIECSECGKKICIITLGYFGVPHHTQPVACCVECLPKRLNELEAKGYDNKKIKAARDWLSGKRSGAEL